MIIKKLFLLTNFSTLFTCLLTIITLLAPVVPHLTEQIYQNLRAEHGYLPELHAKSIHLLSWPCVNHQFIDRELEDSIEIANVSEAVRYHSPFYND